MSIQEDFVKHATTMAQRDPNVIGLAVAGSWITKEVDEFSDVDLVVVTKSKIGGDRDKMIAFAKTLGTFLSGFTGDHVGEPRLLICLFDKPLLHVDIKFVTLPEFSARIENPVIVFDRDNELQQVIKSTEPKFPSPDHQWIEDRFWTWVHYTSVKIGRGENFEAMDFFGFIRMVVLGPMLHLHYGALPRGVRRIETTVSRTDLERLQQTVASHDAKSILNALKQTVSLYQDLRKKVFGTDVVLQHATEKRVLEYLEEIELRLK